MNVIGLRPHYFYRKDSIALGRKGDKWDGSHKDTKSAKGKKYYKYFTRYGDVLGIWI